MSYRAEKLYGKKSGEFKTVLGYVPDTKTKIVRALPGNEIYLAEQTQSSLPLMYILLHKKINDKVWKIIRLCRV